MAYGILVVEDGNELYQIIGEVASPREAEELARGYEDRADPENEDTAVPPSEYVIWRRNQNGAYTVRETLELRRAGAWNLCRADGSMIEAYRDA